MTLTITEVAELTGLTSHALRYYERAGLLPSVGRTRRGHRTYTNLDVTWVRLVSNLRDTGMPVRQVRRFVELVASEAPEQERVALLEQHRASTLDTLAEATRHLAAIEAKLDHLRGTRTDCEAS